MRKVIYGMSVSLDGYMEDASGSLSWQIIEEELHSHFNRPESQFDMHLYCRRLYELMAAYWPTADQDPSAQQVEVEYAEIWRNKPKVVFFFHTQAGRVELQAGERRRWRRGAPAQAATR